MLKIPTRAINFRSRRDFGYLYLVYKLRINENKCEKLPQMVVTSGQTQCLRGNISHQSIFLQHLQLRIAMPQTEYL